MAYVRALFVSAPLLGHSNPTRWDSVVNWARILFAKETVSDSFHMHILGTCYALGLLLGMED